MFRDRPNSIPSPDALRPGPAPLVWLKAGLGLLAIAGAAVSFVACFDPDEETLYACGPEPENRKCPEDFVCNEADWCCHPEGDIDPERLNGCGFDGTPGEGTGASSSTSGGSDSGTTSGGTTETGTTGGDTETSGSGSTSGTDTTGTESGATGTSTGSTGW